MARVQYGVTPWGRWFMDVLDSYNLGARLDRGKRYANTGKVLELAIKGNRVSAKVQGSYSPFYNVEIVFPDMDENDKIEVKKLIEKNPALLARIAAGELPEDFLIELKNSGIALIPQKWQDMKKGCNCPDSVSTCKHIAALYFVLARAIDADPNILFNLRGIDLRGLAEKSGASLEYTLPAPFVITARGTQKETGEAPAKTERIDVLLKEIRHCATFITSLLPSSPPFCTERDFSIVLSEFYHHSSRYAPWGFGTEEDEKAASHSVWTIKWHDGASAVKLVQSDIHGNITEHDIYDVFVKFRDFSDSTGTASYTFLFYLFKFINLIIAACAFTPYPVTENGSLQIIWLVFERLKEIKDAIACICGMEDGMLKLGKKTGKKEAVADGLSVFNLLSSAVLTEYVKLSAFKPSAGGSQTRELCAVFFEGAACDVSAPSRRAYPQAIGRYLAVLFTDFTAYKYRLVLKERSAKANRTTEPMFSLSMDVRVKDAVVPLHGAAKKAGTIDVLKAPLALSNYLPEIQSLSGKIAVVLSEERLVSFLDNAAPLIRRLGIEVILPKTLRRDLRPRLVLNADAADKGSGSLVTYLDLPTLLNFEWRIAIGDTVLTGPEFDALVKQKKQIVRFKDKYVRLDPDELLRLFKTASGGAPKLSANDFLKEHFSGSTVLSMDAKRLLDKIFDKKDFGPPSGLDASLRPYQLRGYNWALSLLLAGFGCVIADDMGLGKTIQAIAVMLRLKAEGLLDGRSLVVAPAALLENWEREIRRFAPGIVLGRYHGKDRSLTADGAEVLLTTYQTAVRDRAKLCAETFALLIADEAHLMKNAATNGAKTVKSLNARFRIALSGTPVENRLEDMRSLFDFILPGYLGSAEKFSKEFRRPIEVMRNPEAAEKLRQITSPFLLRRLKTDKRVISDLPDKITSNEYAALEKEQAALYESVVGVNMDKLKRQEEEGDNPALRHALILQLLTALKQICGHPRVYDKESPAESRLSGKAILMLTLLGEILDGGEKTLIFSQYVETLECLDTIIRNELGEAALIYHGGMNQRKRADAVDRFQTDPAARVLLVSLKAGGLGLNLTAASRVIHYDLWYNPAVEAQATDRAFRIGQKRNVFVHRLITKNSFEEKIDAMLQRKRELADMTVGSGESWLSALSRAELSSLFQRD